MHTKKVLTHEITVADLRSFLAERGHNLPNQFELRYGSAKTITDRIPSDSDTVILWIDYSVNLTDKAP